MYRNLIYIEEYDIYQYFDGDKSFFSHNYIDAAEDSGIESAVSVISKNIIFSAIPKKNLKAVKKFSLNRYLGKYYKNESYFYISGVNGEYGAYHTLPLNIKKYYALFHGINMVIPYDYLAISFLKEKSPNLNLQETFIFIEKTEDIYKIMVVSNGFTVVPVASFNADMLNDNLNILKAKLDSKDIKIEKIVTNCDCDNFGIFFGNTGIVNFTSKDFFEYFEDISGTIPHFENIEIKFKKLEDKKNRLKNIYIAVLIFFIIFMETAYLSYDNKIYHEKQKLVLLNKNISVLSLQVQEDEHIILFDKHFMNVNITGYLKKIFNLFPEGIKIKDINIIKSGDKYIVKGTAFDSGGYRKFADNYNLIIKKLRFRRILKISYSVDKFGKPVMKFLGILK